MQAGQRDLEGYAVPILAEDVPWTPFSCSFASEASLAMQSDRAEGKLVQGLLLEYSSASEGNIVDERAKRSNWLGLQDLQSVSRKTGLRNWVKLVTYTFLLRFIIVAGLIVLTVLNLFK